MLKGHHPLERHRTNARNDPATQREYPYFRPLNLNAGAILTGSGEDGRSGGRRGKEEVRAVTGGHGVGKGKRGRSGRNDSSPPRSLPTSRSLSQPISRKRVKRASKNARQTRPFTSPGIAHSWARTAFFLPLVPVSFRGCSRSRVCPFGRTCVIYASLSGEAKIRKHDFTGVGGGRGRKGETRERCEKGNGLDIAKRPRRKLGAGGNDNKPFAFCASRDRITNVEARPELRVVPRTMRENLRDAKEAIEAVS